MCFGFCRLIASRRDTKRCVSGVPLPTSMVAGRRPPDPGGSGSPLSNVDVHPLSNTVLHQEPRARVQAPNTNPNTNTDTNTRQPARATGPYHHAGATAQEQVQQLGERREPASALGSDGVPSQVDRQHSPCALPFCQHASRSDSRAAAALPQWPDDPFIGISPSEADLGALRNETGRGRRASAEIVEPAQFACTQIACTGASQTTGRASGRPAAATSNTSTGGQLP